MTMAADIELVTVLGGRECPGLGGAGEGGEGGGDRGDHAREEEFKNQSPEKFVHCLVSVFFLSNV